MNEEIKIICDNDVMKYSPDQIYDYIYKLQNNWKELKKDIKKEMKELNPKGLEIGQFNIRNDDYVMGQYGVYKNILDKMQELEQEKDENN